MAQVPGRLPRMWETSIAFLAQTTMPAQLPQSPTPRLAIVIILEMNKWIRDLFLKINELILKERLF